VFFGLNSQPAAGTEFEQSSLGSRRISGMRFLCRRWHRRIPPQGSRFERDPIEPALPDLPVPPDQPMS
jgi:hypothetical protein